MLVQLLVHALYELLERVHVLLNTRLREHVILLDTVKQLREASKTIRFQLTQIFLRQRADIEMFNIDTYNKFLSIFLL